MIDKIFYKFFSWLDKISKDIDNVLTFDFPKPKSKKKKK